MKVTTVRFGTDLWRMLEEESTRVGVSVSQYIREAALARASAAAAARGEDPLSLLAGGSLPEAHDTNPQAVRERAAAIREEHHATSAESQLAIRRSRELRREAATVASADDPNA